MCGRYEFSRVTASDFADGALEEIFRRGVPVKEGEVLPGDLAAVLASSRQRERRAFGMRWGYRMPDGKRIFNARSETAAIKPLFQDGMRQRRCLIPAERWFEWEKPARRKYALGPKGGGSFLLAGIYRLTQGEPEFAVLTREPAENIAFLHDRMPVILPPSVLADWLDPSAPGEEILRWAQLEMQYTPIT